MELCLGTKQMWVSGLRCLLFVVRLTGFGITLERLLYISLRGVLERFN